MRSRRALPALFLALLATNVLAGPAAGISPGGGPQEFVSRPEEDVLLLEARLGELLLTDALPAYRLDGSFLLPLGELSRLLSLALEVDVARGTAEGFVLEESRRFSLRAREGAVTISGTESRFDRSRIEIHEDDLYVDVALLSKWLPVDLVVDPYAARVTVRPREPLPVQLRAERERGAARLASARRAPEGYPDAPNPYRLASAPSLDANLRLLVSPDDGGGQRLGFQHSALLAGDLLGAEASLFLNGNDGESVSDIWGSLARRDPDGNLLGPLGLREAVLGEVASPGFELVSDAQTGPGFLLSSFPLQRPSEWGRTSLSGPLLPGWEVELYGNDALLGYQASRADGLYEFADVPLLPGANELRLVFYGPQGQRQEEVRRFNAAETFTPAGELRWRVVANDPRQVGRRGHLLAEYGLSKGLSISGGLAGLRTELGKELGYGRLGAQLLRGIFLARVDGALSGGNGTALRGELQARTKTFGLSAAWSVLDRFESEVYRPEFGTVSSRLELRLDVRPYLGAGLRLPIAGQLRRDALKGGGDLVRATGQLSTSVSRLYLSSLWSWSRVRRPGSTTESIGFGSVLVSRLVRRTSLRGEVQYDFDPETTLRSAGLNAEFPIGMKLLGRGGFTYLRREGETLLIAGLSRRPGILGVTFEATWGRSSRLNASLSVGIGLGRDPRSGRFHAQAPPFAALGAASARVFLDTNGDGVFNAGAARRRGGLLRQPRERPDDDRSGRAGASPDPSDARADGGGTFDRDSRGPALGGEAARLGLRPEARRRHGARLPDHGHGRGDRDDPHSSRRPGARGARHPSPDRLLLRRGRRRDTDRLRRFLRPSANPAGPLRSPRRPVSGGEARARGRAREDDRNLPLRLDPGRHRPPPRSGRSRGVRVPR